MPIDMGPNSGFAIPKSGAARKPAKDVVEERVHREVLKRDGMCFLAIVNKKHQCRDTFGELHASTDLRKLTVDHVKGEPRMGKRAPSDVRHLVAMCAGSNIPGPSADVREKAREYLAGFYGA